MATDPSTGGRERPAFRAEDWDSNKERESFRAFLESTKDALDHKETMTVSARRTAERLQLALKIPSEDAQRIVSKYLDDLAGTMNERLTLEGQGIRKAYTELINDRDRGTKAMENRLSKLTGLTEKDRKSLEAILSHFCLLKEGEKGTSYLTRWMNRDATNGRLAQQDYAVFKRIHAPQGTPEKAFLDQLYQNMLELRKMDPQNLTFIDSAPSVSGGGKFVLSLLLGGIALFSLLMARKSGRIPKKGLIAIGLLFYLHRNPQSKLSFLSTPQYEELTKDLRGSKQGQEIIAALGDRRYRTALKNFTKREQQRQTIPAGARGNLSSSEQSLKDLSAALGLSPSAEALLKTKSPQQIAALSATLQKFNPEELNITGEFVKSGATKKSIDDIKVEGDPSAPSS
jgi:hypothetical protein